MAQDTTTAVLSFTTPQDCGAALPLSDSTRGDLRSLPLLQRKILAHLSSKATDARGYATLVLAGHNLTELDEAVAALHRHGLVNAFFIPRAAQPRFQPSSLTPAGRLVFDGLARISAS
jgi:hypothetical protein